MQRVVKTILQGLSVTLPIIVTVYIVLWLGRGAERLLGGWIEGAVGEALYWPGMGILTGLVAVFMIGLLVNLWVVRTIISWGERLLERIPLVKTIYGGIRDLMGFFQGRSKDSGPSHVVIVTVSGLRLLGFVTQDNFESLPSGMGGEGDVAVYLPMSYQIGGFTVFVPRSAVTPVDMTVEDAMRFAMTAGMSLEKRDAPQADATGGQAGAGPA